MMLTINKLESDDFGPAIQNESLITNGAGGYASSTVSGAYRRRYHTLLVAATHPPVMNQRSRFLVVASTELQSAELAYDDRAVERGETPQAEAELLKPIPYGRVRQTDDLVRAASGLPRTNQTRLRGQTCLWMAV